MDLSACKIDDLDAFTVSLYLNEKQNEVEVFQIGANLLTDDGLVTILSGIQWHSNLKELHIGNHK